MLNVLLSFCQVTLGLRGNSVEISLKGPWLTGGQYTGPNTSTWQAEFRAVLSSLRFAQTKNVKPVDKIITSARHFPAVLLFRNEREQSKSRLQLALQAPRP